MTRPFCSICNQIPCTINYIRNGVTHYRSMCHVCGKQQKKKKSGKLLWEKAGYKKSTECNLCGFKCLYHQQMTVFHIDGNLENVAFSNLRTICLNCIEVVKRKKVNWRRGDLRIDK
jgi:hypothetical protein